MIGSNYPSVIASSAPVVGGRPSVDETVGEVMHSKGAVGSEVGFCLFRGSPVASWTWGGSMTPTGAKGLHAPEHDC